MNRLKVLTLFGGIGAPEKALVNLGIPHKQIDYVEIDEKAVRTYNALFHDLQKHKPQSVVGWNFKPDILVHGSPCQDFSRAGSRWGGGKEDETRSSLLFETIKIIQGLGDWKPRVVIWENVKGVLDKDMIDAFNNYLLELDELGYYSTYKVLDARDFGIPQARERVFVVSTLQSTFNFKTLRKRKTVDINQFLEKEAHERYLVTQPSMMRRLDLPENDDLAFSGRVKIIDDYCYTITTKQVRSPNAGVIDLGNGKYRYLTERECWRLMGFSDEDYDKAEKEHPRRGEFMNGTLYHQAGNSIVVDVLEAIFEGIFEQGILSKENNASYRKSKIIVEEVGKQVKE